MRLVKKMKGLRSTSWLLQRNHGDVKFGIGNTDNNTIITVWCQMGTRLLGVITS